jgi:hypothetical protein
MYSHCRIAEKTNEMRAYKLHELVNKLPDIKKQSMKALFGLLSEIAKEHETNRVLLSHVMYADSCMLHALF